ncbi:MAG: hypothetical protein NTAFB09_23000 [Nitrosospira sp.]|jgi:hypothetical protein|nr:MAG: hypothetical protein BGO99_06980 [Nitrosospira sp. 56-18]
MGGVRVFRPEVKTFYAVDDHQAGQILEHLIFFKEKIMEMAILVVGIGAVVAWFFMSKDGRKE